MTLDCPWRVRRKRTHPYRHDGIRCFAKFTDLGSSTPPDLPPGVGGLRVIVGGRDADAAQRFFAMFDDNDILDLPEDELEALVVFEGRMRKYFYRDLSDQNSIAERNYMNNLNAYMQVFGPMGVISANIGDNETLVLACSRLMEKFDEFAPRIKMKRLKAIKEGTSSTILLKQDAITEIHQHLIEMRVIISEMDLADSKRDAILIKINALATEVDTSNTRLENWSRLSIELAETSEAIAKRLDPVHKLLEKVFKRLGQSQKEIQKLPPADKPIAIEGPKNDTEEVIDIDFTEV